MEQYDYAYIVLCNSTEQVRRLLNKPGKVFQKVHAIYGIEDLQNLLETVQNLLQNLENEEEICEYLGSKKELLSLRLYQRMTVKKLYGKKGISLVGHKARSGKTYTCAGDIINHQFNRVVLITSVPNNTQSQFASIFNKIYQLREYTFLSYNECINLPEDDRKYFFFISKQSLEKEERREMVKNWIIDKHSAIYVDEVHYASSSLLSQQIISFLKDFSSTHVVFLTATYASVLEKWLRDIPKERIFTWFFLNLV